MQAASVLCNSFDLLPTIYSAYTSLNACNTNCLNNLSCLVSSYNHVSQKCTHYTKCTFIKDISHPQTTGTTYYIKKGIFTFDTCGGYTNQKLSIIQGIQIAEELNWNLVLPMLNVNGEQSGQTYQETHSKKVKFDYFYDSEVLKKKIPLKVLNNDNTYNFTRVDISKYSNLKKLLRDIKGSYKNVKISCPLMKFHITIQDLKRIKTYLQSSSSIMKAADSIIEKMPQKYYSLHYRLEDDWFKHCKTWTSPTRRNCLTNSDRLPNLFTIEGVEPEDAIYVMGSCKHTNLNFIKNKYTNTMPYDEAYREWFAAIDYEVGLRSVRFFGNSVSTFSAFMFLERFNNDDVWYNAENVPLFDVLFGTETSKSITDMYNEQLKWVFVYSSFTKNYNQNIKVAVLSANDTDLIPVCIYFGPRDYMYYWFIENNVRIIFHNPSWINKINENFDKALRNINFASTYMSNNSLIATYLRIDIPILGFRDDYILYTDTDVLFMKTPKFNNKPSYYINGAESDESVCGFQANVPVTNKFVGKSYKMKNSRYIKYGNAGIMYMNMNNLRNVYESFVDFTFSDVNLQKGLHHGVYGPADQGAYNEYFQSAFECMQYPLFNWKPYWVENKDAQIIHFHGPKIKDYVSYLKHGIVLNVNYERLLKRCTDCNRYVEYWLEINKTIID